MSYNTPRTLHDNHDVDKQYVLASVEERLAAWRDAEQCAVRAEQALSQMGQAAADPRARDLFAEAKRLRVEADRQFGALVRAVKAGDADVWGDSANEGQQAGNQQSRN